jgi:hypothetical protein
MMNVYALLGIHAGASPVDQVHPIINAGALDSVMTFHANDGMDFTGGIDASCFLQPGIEGFDLFNRDIEGVVAMVMVPAPIAVDSGLLNLLT